MVEDKDIICVILLLFLFYVMFHKKTEGFNNFNLTPLLGELRRNWNENPPLFYR